MFEKCLGEKKVQEKRSRQPNPHASELNEEKEAFGQFRIASGNPPVLLELLEETLNKMPLLVLVVIAGPRLLFIGFGRNAHSAAA